MSSDSGKGGELVAPAREEVISRYDDMMMLTADLGEGTLHQGYWESPSDQATLAEASERLTDIMAGKLRIGPGDRVLDLGCGVGDPAIRLGRTRGVAVVGVTNSPAQVRIATERARAAGVGDLVTFRCADAMDLPFEPDSFDAAWLIESIFAMPDRLSVLRQAARVLRPGARVVLTDILDRTPEGAERREAPALARPIRLADEAPLFRRAGLEPVELTDITEHVVDRSLAAILRTLRDDRERLVGRHGSRLVELYEATLPALKAAGWGYGLCVAAVPS